MVLVATSSFSIIMCRWFYILLLVAIDLSRIHSFAIDNKAEIEQNPSLKTTANQTTDQPFAKVREIDHSVVSGGHKILRGVIDDQTTHLFFGEADSFGGSSNIGVGGGFPADAFGTLLTPIKQQIQNENQADSPVLIFATDGPLQKVQTGMVSDIPPPSDAKKPIENSELVDKANAFFQGSQSDLIISPIIPVRDEVATEKTAEGVVVSKIDEPLPDSGQQFQISRDQVPQIQSETNIGKPHSFVTDSNISETKTDRQPTISNQITHVQETEISLGTAAESTLAQSPAHPTEADTFHMEHKGDFAVELNPITKEGVNMRSQTATSFNLPTAARHLPVLKMKQVFSIRFQPSVNSTRLAVEHWQHDDSSVEFLLDDRSPIQPEAGEVRQHSPMPTTDGIAGVEEASVGKIDSLVLDDIAEARYFNQEANVDVDSIVVGKETPTVILVDQVSPSEQDSLVVVNVDEEGTQSNTDVEIITPILPELVLDTDSIVFGSQDEGEIRSETHLGSVDDIALGEIRERNQFQQRTDIGESARNGMASGSIISQIEEGTEMRGTVGYQVAEANQPADKHNQISDERAMRSAFASIASGTEQLGNSHAQRPINVNRRITDEDDDEPSVSIEIKGLAPNQHDRGNLTAIQRNRTVHIELDDGFVSTEVIGHIDGNQTIHFPRLDQELGKPLTDAPRRAGNRHPGKLRTVTMKPIQTAIKEKHSDEVQEDTSVERVTEQNSQTHQFPRDSNEQNDQSMEVNFRLLSKIKRIMKPELRKQEKRPSMVFFQHSEEEKDASVELNDILANPLFQQKMQEIDKRLKSAPEARGKRLMEKYAEALAISSSSSSLIINSFLPFFIVLLLICW